MINEVYFKVLGFKKDQHLCFMHHMFNTTHQVWWPHTRATALNIYLNNLTPISRTHQIYSTSAMTSLSNNSLYSFTTTILISHQDTSDIIYLLHFHHQIIVITKTTHHILTTTTTPPPNPLFLHVITTTTSPP